MVKKDYNPKKLVKDFFKSEERILKIPYTGKKMNAMWGWMRLQNPIRTYFNAAVSEIGKKMFSLKLKNSLYRLTGAKIGKDVSLGPNFFMECIFPNLVTIEDGVLIGGHSQVSGHEFVLKETMLGKTLIKKNVMIGSYVFVRAGVTIGENSIISSQSFVNKDVPANEFWGGVPARFIKKLK